MKSLEKEGIALDRDPYQVLGVSPNATEDEIRQAYRTLAKKYHPDLNPNDPAAAQKMNEVNEAYDKIKNPQAYRQQQAQQQYQQQARQQYQNQQYYDPFAAFWGTQNQNQQSHSYTYYTNYRPQQDGEQQNPFQYQWTYHRTRRRGSILGKIFLIYLLFQLFYGLFGGCSYYYLNPYGYSSYDSSSYSDTYQGSSQQQDPYYSYGFGSQKTTGTQEG